MSTISLIAFLVGHITSVSAQVPRSTIGSILVSCIVFLTPSVPGLLQAELYQRVNTISSGEVTNIRLSARKHVARWALGAWFGHLQSTQVPQLTMLWVGRTKDLYPGNLTSVEVCGKNFHWKWKGAHNWYGQHVKLHFGFEKIRANPKSTIQEPKREQSESEWGQNRPNTNRRQKGTKKNDYEWR